MPFALRPYGALALAALTLFFGCVQAQDETVIEADDVRLRVTTITDGLVHPWGLAFLPDGDMLVTERAGTLRRVSPSGEKGSAIEGLPEVISRGQGGLVAVAPEPDFHRQRRV